MKKPTRYQQIILLSITFFLLMVLVAVFHGDGILKVYKFQEELATLKQSNMELKEQNLRFEKMAATLKTDPFAIEKIAREKLRMAKPGETVYHIVSQDNNF